MGEEKCPTCGYNLTFSKTENTIHYGRLDCYRCNKFIKWVRNPETKEKNRYETSKYSIQQVLKFHDKNKELCFWCLRTKDILGTHETLTIDHIEELDKGGKDELGNLQILCSACHKLKNWTRLYLHWHLKKEEGDNANT